MAEDSKELKRQHTRIEISGSAKLDPTDAEQALVASEGAAFLGIHVATMNSDGNLYSLQHRVARLGRRTCVVNDARAIRQQTRRR